MTLNSFGRRYRFADWPNKEVPRSAAGVYVVWDSDRLVYVGMSGRGMTEEELARVTKPTGLCTRLASHASGKLSGDQFCVYVANRLVLPMLTPDDISDCAAGTRCLDGFTREYIAGRLEYQFVTCRDGQEALALETRLRREGLGGQMPILNQGG